MNSEFFLTETDCFIKAKETIVGVKSDGYLTLTRALEQIETQTVYSRVCTRVPDCIKHDDNRTYSISYDHKCASSNQESKVFGEVTSLGEGKPDKLRLKIDLVSNPARAEGLVNRVKYLQCNCYCDGKWSRRPYTRLFAFDLRLIYLGKGMHAIFNSAVISKVNWLNSA